MVHYVCVCVCVSCLVKIAGSANRSHFIGVVEEANAGLGQAVTFPDRDLSEPAQELLPNVGPQAASCRQTNSVSFLLWNLTTEARYVNRERRTNRVSGRFPPPPELPVLLLSPLDG